MRLILRHPEVAFRSCETCAKYVHNEKTGRIRTWRGKPVPRPDGTGPPCRTCPKQSPRAGVELTQSNWLAYLHYRECHAVGAFPDDATVRRTADICSQIESQMERAELLELVTLSTVRRYG